VYHAPVKVYTRTGDRGETSLFSGGRVAKDHARIEAYGTLDELNAVLGLLLVEPLPQGVARKLIDVQEVLFSLGSALADPEGRLDHDPSQRAAGPLERWIDHMEEDLAPLRVFILPGGCRGAALAHFARTVCRRAERRVGTLEGADVGVPEGVVPYVNRLSDALFVLARYLNSQLGIADRQWKGRRKDDSGDE